jgi:hypothetical protein
MKKRKKKMRALFVVGTFDDNGGRPTSYGDALVGWCLAKGTFKSNKVINGGKFDDLCNINFNDFDTIFWFADVPNDKPKMVREIKRINPTCMLVTAKRNDGDKYSCLELVARALQTKSNLIVEFKKNGKLIDGSLFDPLGNCYIRAATLPGALAAAMLGRLNQLRQFTRKPSVRIGDITPFAGVGEEIADEFMALVEMYATKFHKLIHADTSRFLGNASFRCECGFPSFRDEDKIYVTKRNIDKRNIGVNGFVAVEDTPKCVGYYGENKPSVDTPIQLALYKAYPRINFMIHSHTYIHGAPTTKKIIPCGAMEEGEEIIQMVPDSRCNWFFVNLLGHGSICAGERCCMLGDVKYYAREVPELHRIEI